VCVVTYTDRRADNDIAGETVGKVTSSRAHCSEVLPIWWRMCLLKKKTSFSYCWSLGVSPVSTAYARNS
jgi:hypothetical protein